MFRCLFGWSIVASQLGQGEFRTQEKRWFNQGNPGAHHLEFGWRHCTEESFSGIRRAPSKIRTLGLAVAIFLPRFGTPHGTEEAASAASSSTHNENFCNRQATICPVETAPDVVAWIHPPNLRLIFAAIIPQRPIFVLFSPQKLSLDRTRTSDSLPTATFQGMR